MKNPPKRMNSRGANKMSELFSNLDPILIYVYIKLE